MFAAAHVNGDDLGLIFVIIAVLMFLGAGYLAYLGRIAAAVCLAVVALIFAVVFLA